MNSFTVLRDNKKNIDTIHDALMATLAALSKDNPFEISKGEATVEANDAGIEVSVASLIRFATAKGIATYALGFTDAQSQQVWKELFPPKTGAPGTNPKSHEFEMTKNLFIALDPILKALGFTTDPKTIVYQEGAALGGWGKITVQQTARLPFTTPKGVLSFAIPIFDVEYVQALTHSLYGFRDTARILVVDDSQVSRQHSRSCLAMGGYFNIDEAADGQAALTRVMGASPPFELVVADWHMPVMSGFDLLKKIRGIPEFKKLPVVLVTGEKNKEEIIAAIREGVTSYLVKPVAPENFLGALKKAGGRG